MGEKLLWLMDTTLWLSRSIVRTQLRIIKWRLSITIIFFSSNSEVKRQTKVAKQCGSGLQRRVLEKKGKNIARFHGFVFCRLALHGSNGMYSVCFVPTFIHIHVSSRLLQVIRNSGRLSAARFHSNITSINVFHFLIIWRLIARIE